MKGINILIVLFVMCINVYAQEAISDKNNNIEYVSFGEKIDVEKVVSSDVILGKYQEMKLADTTKVKFSAVITDVCKAKGCWMKLSLGNKQEVMVRFKDYGFFMPKGIEGKKVIVSGLAFTEEMSVVDQQHYAKDAGKSEEDIVKITKTKKTYGFTAEGVLLKNNLKREIITTADGSKTIHIPEWNEQYHSKHGAIQEAYHVFIKHGLSLFSNTSISILEIGFGTGLNALITFIEAKKQNLTINYKGVEAFPISSEELSSLNYLSQLKAEACTEIFDKMHTVAWECVSEISEDFKLKKEKKDFSEIEDSNVFDLIYFDAFGARVQPELWTEDIFKIMFAALKEDSYLVTYSAKGSVRRAMQAVGFVVERLPGPPGKREMLRGYKARL